jgi:hypothetical protein
MASSTPCVADGRVYALGSTHFHDDYTMLVPGLYRQLDYPDVASLAMPSALLVINGKKDGYTLLYAGASSFIYAPITNPEIVHYDPAKDVEPNSGHRGRRGRRICRRRVSRLRCGRVGW